MSSLVTVPSAISLDSTAAPNSETLADNLVSASVPKLMAEALRLVRREPLTAGNWVEPLSWTSWPALLKLLPWMVTSGGKLIKLTSPVMVLAAVAPAIQPDALQTKLLLIVKPLLLRDVWPLEAKSVPLDCTSPVTCNNVPGATSS